MLSRVSIIHSISFVVCAWTWCCVQAVGSAINDTQCGFVALQTKLEVLHKESSKYLRGGDETAIQTTEHGWAAVKGRSAPMLFFLFLAEGNINNEEIWKRFFASADNFRVFVHCRDEASCRKKIKASQTFEIIPTVPTEWCTDLVSGQIALVRAALDNGGAGNPNDKFIFLSDSTLPVKPFNIVQQKLTVGPSSNFCLFPQNEEWAEFTEDGTEERKALVKHHQWIILSREHAVTVSDRANRARRFKKEGEALLDNYRRYWHRRGSASHGVCLDELWAFAILYPSLSMSDGAIDLEKFSGSPLSFGSTEIQGKCDTFAQWLSSASGTHNNMTQLAKELASDRDLKTSPLPDHKPYGPVVWNRLSEKALVTLRQSSFLFIRKIDDKCAFSGCGDIADAFDSVVFSTPSKPLPACD